MASAMSTPRARKSASPRPRQSASHAPAASWTFLTNHAHVLICLSENPDQTLREVAERVGITERAVQKIVADLEEAGIIVRERDGRRNHYRIHLNKPLRHPIESHRSVADLIQLIVSR